MAVSKLERLLNLINVLLDAPRPLRASELATRVPGYPPDEASFRRAFERDKDDLREMGVPLRLEDVPASNPPAQGYRIRQDEYYLRDPGLEPEELEALNLAAATVQLDGTPPRMPPRQSGPVSSAITHIVSSSSCVRPSRPSSFSPARALRSSMVPVTLSAS